MKHNEHTPGPWEAQLVNSLFYRIESRDSHTVAQSVRRHEDAILIAQSPIMLALLIEEVEYLQYWMKSLNPDDMMYSLMKERKEFIEITINNARIVK